MRTVITAPKVTESDFVEIASRTHVPAQSKTDRRLLKAIDDMGLPMSSGTVGLPDSQRLFVTHITPADDQRQIVGWNIYAWDTVIDDWQPIAYLRIVAYPDYPDIYAATLAGMHPHADVTVYDIHDLPGDIVTVYLEWLAAHGVYPPQMDHRTDVTSADLARYQRTGRL